MQRWILLGLLAALLAPAASANAQEFWSQPRIGLGVALSAYTPFDPGVQSAYPTLWGGLNLSYNAAGGRSLVHRFGLGANITTRKVDSGFLFTYYGAGVYRTDASLILIPLTYTLVAGPGATDRGIYLGAGPGLYIAQSEVSAEITMGFNSIKDSNRLWSARGGVHGVLGYAFSPRFAAELTYVHMLTDHNILRYQDASVTRRLDGVSLSLMGRF